MNHSLKTGSICEGGVICPHCFIRQKPQISGNVVVICQTCNGIYRTPQGYGVQQPATKDKTGLLPADLRERGYSLQVENGNTAILYLDGKEIRHWYRSTPELTLEQIYAEIRSLTDYNELIRQQDRVLQGAG